MLLLALWMSPQSARSAQWEPKPAQATLPSTDNRAPVPLSMLDVLGKLSIAALAVYGLGFGLKRARDGGLLGHWGVLPTPGPASRVQLCETLSLGRGQGTLYLLEVDDRSMLLGASLDGLQVLWQAAPEKTASFPPVEAAPPAEPVETPQPLPQLPLLQQGFAMPARNEADWARERSRLISSLVQAE
jgi:flagellar biogenesis protein FliO